MISYSVVVPLKDEAQSLSQLHPEVSEVLKRLGKPYEIIYVDDGSSDNSPRVLSHLKKEDPHVRVITFRTNFGKSEALNAGFRAAGGSTIITLDADLQDDPHEIPQLLNKLKEGYDLVIGWRRVRQDRPVKKLSSSFFNLSAALISGVKLHDINCGLKVLTKEVADNIYLYGELHRFLPILAAKRKFRVAEVVVAHRPRRFGVSKYGKLGLGRGWRGMVDLLTSIFVSDYAAKPAHFFGKIGLVLFLIGFVMDAYVTYLKVTTGTTQGKIPLLLAGILFLILGIQLLSTGLIAEMITYYFRSQRKT